MSVYDVEGGWRYVSPLEDRAFLIDISEYPNSLLSIKSTSLYDISDIDSLSAVSGSPLSGLTTHTDGVITTQRVSGAALTANAKYELRIVWEDTALNDWLVTIPIICAE